MYRNIIILLLFLLGTNTAYSQNIVATKQVEHPCFSKAIKQLYTNNNLNADSIRKSIDENILNLTLSNKGMLKTGSDQLITIPVVFHIIHPPNTPIGTGSNLEDSRIHLVVQQLNEAFSNTGDFKSDDGADTGFRFCLAKNNPQGLPSSGINRMASATYSNMNIIGNEPEIKQNTIRWDAFKYMNIWVVDEVCFGTDCEIGGYSYQAETHGSIYDGIVIEDTYVSQNIQFTKILIHEIGHYLDLLHTFEGGCTNSNCLTDNDKICDTPPENSLLAHTCDSFPNSCNTDTNDTSLNNPFRPISLGGLGDQNDMIENYMDYGYLNCRTSFTEGQIQRMRLSFMENRTSLLSTNACTLEDNIFVDVDYCTPPMATQVNTENATNVNIGWSEVPAASGYLIEYRIVGSDTFYNATTSGTQITLDNLIPGTSYVYTIKSICSGSTSSAFTIDYFNTIIESCPKPNNLSISNVSEYSALATWSAINNATEYNIYLKTGNGPYVAYPVNSNSKYFTTLSPATIYKIKVTAICDETESDYSNEITFNTPALVQVNCVAPTGVSISYIVSSSCLVSWNPVNDADKYKIGYKKEGTENYTFTEVNNTQYVIMGLEAETKYFVKLASICGDETVYGNSVYDFFTAEDESITVCPLPTNLQALNITSNSASLDWAQVAEASSYVVHIRENGGTWIPYNANESNLQVNFLEENTYYQFRVYAICSGTSGESSSIIGFTTEAAPIECIAPSNLNTQNITANNATVTWNNISNATNYGVQIREFGTSTWASYNTSNNTYTFTNLEAATSYVVIVNSSCGEFSSGQYSTITFLTNNEPIQPCLAPQNLSVNNVSQQSANFSWDSGNETNTFYLNIREINQEWISYTTSSTQYSLNNLKSGTSYQVRVSASCDGISSPFSSIQTFTTSNPPPPPVTTNNCIAPSGLTVNDITQSSVTATWNALPNTPLYIIGIAESVIENDWEYQITGNTSNTFTGLKSNTNYRIKIRRMCDGIAGDFSEEYLFTTTGESPTNTDNSGNPEPETPIYNDDICAYPTGIGVNNIQGTSANIYWNDNSKASQYIIFIKSENNPIPNIQYIFENSYLATNLVPNTNYEVRIKCICGLEISENSPVFNFNSGNINVPEIPEEPEVPTNTYCETPTGLNILALGTNIIEVDWNAVSGAMFYQAELFKDGISEEIMTVTGTSATFNINTNANLVVRVRAHCSQSWSDYSDFMTIATETEQAACEVPINLIASNIENTNANLSWSVIPEAYYYELKVWQVGYPEIVQNYNITGTVKNVNLLTSCISYQWRVRAVCPTGKGEYSETNSFTTSCSISVCAAQGLNTGLGYITQVKILDEGKISENDNGYGNYLSSSFSLNAGSSNSFDLQTNTENPFYWGIWIDRNEDGIFDKFNERVYISTTPRYGSCAGFITISPDAETQTTSMRVIMSSNSDINPCQDFENGEVEDYTIHIIAD